VSEGPLFDPRDFIIAGVMTRYSQHIRHSGAGRNPESYFWSWTPAFAGVTKLSQ
jgi:hypothetical protein